jgi:hypothetical protein
MGNKQPRRRVFLLGEIDQHAVNMDWPWFGNTNLCLRRPFITHRVPTDEKMREMLNGFLETESITREVTNCTPLVPDLAQIVACYAPIHLQMPQPLFIFLSKTECCRMGSNPWKSGQCTFVCFECTQRGGALEDFRFTKKLTGEPQLFPYARK